MRKLLLIFTLIFMVTSCDDNMSYKQEMSDTQLIEAIISDPNKFEIEEESPLLGNEGDKTINGMPKLSYRIQIGMFKQRKSEQSSYLREVGFKIVEEQAPNGFYRYLTEDFYSLEGTKDKVDILKVKGYDKAYIVPYFEGKRTKLSPEQAKEKYGK